MSLLIKNIKSLIQTEKGRNRRFKINGAEMNRLEHLEDAFLLIENDRIFRFGKMIELESFPLRDLALGQDGTFHTEIDATGKMVFPCWCDSHTHLVYSGSREQEFVDRIHGLSYQDIANRGGGILNSAKKIRDASEEELIQNALLRLKEMMLQGTGAVEIKSGYGLSLKAELKMLRVIKKLKSLTPISIKATFLGAHAVPAEYSKEKYMDVIINEMLPQIAEEKLADFCDVFCEKKYFTKEETINILRAASQYELQGKVHAEQLSNSGGIEAGVASNAISVDHLEYAEAKDIDLLSRSNTIPTLLPGAQFFLQLPHPPVRKMLDAGLPLALASDYNPGSSPSGNMNLMIALACIQYKMSPEEAINAATINSACAMGLSETHGSIAVGKKANVFITKEIPDYAYMPYSYGSNLIETVILNGIINT